MSESQPSTARTVRLVVPASTSTAIDNVLVEVAYQAGSKINKAQLTDALLKVGMAHLSEVAAQVRREQAGGSDE
jgi:hypothetical protein